MASHRAGELQGVFHGHSLVGPGVEEKGRRCFLRDLFFVGEQFQEFGARMVAQEVSAGSGVGKLAHRDDRVTEDSKVGT